jgi:hypothetical protein
MTFTDKRENEEVMMKLDRILSFCGNTKETIETMIVKYTHNFPEYTDDRLKDDMKNISTNLDAMMTLVDPIFKHYLILPSSTENENGTFNKINC